MTASEDYPDVDFPWAPCSVFVLVQVKRPRTKSKGGIHFVSDTIDDAIWAQDEGVVRGIGTVAYRFRESGEKWPGYDDLPQVGDLVRFPKYGGAAFYANEHDPENKVKFLIFKDNELVLRQIGK